MMVDCEKEGRQRGKLKGQRRGVAHSGVFVFTVTAAVSGVASTSVAQDVRVLQGPASVYRSFHFAFFPFPTLRGNAPRPAAYGCYPDTWRCVRKTPREK